MADAQRTPAVVDLGLRIGSLFSGIGGLDLGLEWAGLGRTIWQVERDPFCRRKLAWRWPDAQRFAQVEDVGAANLLPVDIICGGFPCQDVSSAGRRVGLAGPRSGLWDHFARIAGEMRPRWIVVENVRSGAAAWVDPVRRDLERIGYATLPIPVAASDCGAPHERARVFVLACRGAAAADGDRAIGPAAKGPPANPDGAGVRIEPGRDVGARWAAGPLFAAHAAADADDHRRHVHAVPDEGGARAGHDAAGHGGWAAEPPLVRVVHGFPGRVDHERALGNAVVPQCAEVVGHVIRQLIDAEPGA